VTMNIIIELLKTLKANKPFLFVLIFLILTNLAILLDIYCLRQFFGFFFLTILPGVLILKILKLDKLDTIDSILYTVGLSISFLMLTGFFMNTLYPHLGISEPISYLPLIITINLIILMFFFIGHWSSKDFSNICSINKKDLLSPSLLILILLPILAVLGVCLVNFYENSNLLFLLIVMISLTVVFAISDKIPKRLYPLAINMISLALLFHSALIPFYLANGDIHREYYIYNLVEKNSFWDMTIENNINAMLSIVMLPAIYSKILQIDGQWVFLIIYSLIYSLVPLALYQIYRKQINEKAAFLSSFFFMSMYVYFNSMPALCRQEIAELFYVLFVLILVNKKLDKLKRIFLLIIFGISIAVSHYGLSYIFMFQIILANLLLSGIESTTIISLKDTLYSKYNKFRITNLIANDLQMKHDNLAQKKDSTFSINFVLLYIAFTLTWYIYVSNLSIFNSIVTIGEQMYYSVFSDFFSASAREPMVLSAIGVASPIEHWLSYISRPIYLSTEFFIVVGLIRIITKYKDMKFDREYLVMLLTSSALIFACIIIPTFAQRLNTQRTYHIALILVAPLCILGGEIVFKQFIKLFKLISLKQSTCKVLLIILIPYFLFNTGFILTLSGVKNAMPLGLLELSKTGDDRDKAIYYICMIQKEDVYGARYLEKVRLRNEIIYADWISSNGRLNSYASLMPSSCKLLATKKNLEINSLVFLGYFNVKENLILTSYVAGKMVINKTTEILGPSFVKNKIYSNGGSEIYG